MRRWQLKFSKQTGRLSGTAAGVILLLVLGSGLMVWQHRAIAAPCPCTLFGQDANPAGATVFDDEVPTELGVNFKPEANGYITGIRFYKDASMDETHVGNLWRAADKSLLASGTFSNETASGWQTLTFDTPVAVSASTYYTASFYSPAGKYVATPTYFTNDSDEAPLFVPSDATAKAASLAGNGVYNSGSDGYPSHSYNSANYWVDAIFQASPDGAAPQVTATSPVDDATDIYPSKTITATFDQSLDAASVTTDSVELKDDNGQSVATTVSYKSAQQQLAIQPASLLALNSPYTVTIHGGASGVKSLDGTPLTADYSWSFTTGDTSCPCSIWEDTALTGTVATSTDVNKVALGQIVHANADGYIHAVRFYKSIKSTAVTHTVHVWSASGSLLATATSSNESAYGWQEVPLTTPVPVVKGQNYTVSYFASDKTYVSSDDALSSEAGNGPIRANAGGARYAYNDTGEVFPNQTASGSPNISYWVDAVFSADDSYTAPFDVTLAQPLDKAYGVSTAVPLEFTLSNPVDESTVAGSVTLKDATDQTVAGTAGYDADTRELTFTPSASLQNQTGYTVAISGLKDAYGTTLTPFASSFTTGAALSTDINQGAGGPILVVTASSNPYDKYMAEMLRTEGINYFTVKDIGDIAPDLLDQYRVVLLGEAALTSQQVSDLTDWVQAGGNLIAMRPDKQLASLLGLTDQSQTLSDSYIKVDTSQPPGDGITAETMQYHAAADRYTANSGTATVATLYSDADTATTSPAVTSRTVGSGHAAAWTYDLPKSIALTHQGNPAMVGLDVDADGRHRPNELFMHQGSGTDWLNTAKAHIPQADEQQRLLVNMIEHMTTDSTPLPRYWILPHGLKSALVMEMDDHGTTEGSFDAFNDVLNSSSTNCSVLDWQCNRSGSMLYTDSGLTPAQALLAHKLDFGVGVHISTGCGDYPDYNTLLNTYSLLLSEFQAKYTGVPPQRVTRTHCYIWSDWNSTPKADVANGLRLNMNYEWYPAAWTGTNNGYLTGSGLAMRFVDSDGNMVNDYQGVTDLDYETDPTNATMIADLDNTINSNEFYGVLGTHYDFSTGNPKYYQMLMAAAQARDIPMISGNQLITWKDALNSSTFSDITSAPSELTFTAEVAEGGEGMQAMVPASTSAGTISSLTVDGNAVDYDTKTIKGVSYATFDAQPGTYQVEYGTAATFIPSDINEDNKVDYLDLSVLSTEYGQAGAGIGRADINGDGKVDYLDLSVLATKYGSL